MFPFVGFIVIVAIVGIVNGQSYSNATNLRTTLLSTYNPDVIPLNNYSEVLKVNLTLYFYSLPDVDPVRGTVLVGIQVLEQWYDELMTWTPADYCGIEDVLIMKSEVWTPPVSAAQAIEVVKLGKSWMRVKYLSDGLAFFDPGDIIEITCSFHMKYWPFDKQVCILAFFSWGYTSDKIQLLPSSEVFSTAFFQENGEWTLDKDSVQYRSRNVYGYSQLQYKIKLHRKPEFYILTIIMPLNFIGGLACLVFLLPSESGERVSFITTIVLSLAVFLTVVADDIPKTSSPLPLMCVFIIFEMLVSIIATVLVILNLMIYHRNDDVPVTSWYLSLVNLSRCRRNKIQQQQKRQQNENIDDLIKQPNLFPNRRSAEETEEHTKTISTGVLLKNIHNAKNRKDLTWKEVSESIDRLLFYSMVVMTYLPSILIIVILIATSDYSDSYGSGWQ